MEESLKEKIVKLRKEKKSYDEIKNLLGCAKSTISYFCKKENLDKLNLVVSPTKLEIEEMQLFYDKCKSANKTAKHFGWSKSTILKYLETKSRVVLTAKERKQKNIDASLNHRRKTKKY